MQELHRVVNMPQYGWICLNMTWTCLNMSEFRIIRFLNKYHTIHDTCIQCKVNLQVNEYLLRGRCIQCQVKDLRWSPLEKQLQLLFLQKNSILNLWQGLEYVLDFKYINLLNIYKFSLKWQGYEYALGCNYRRVLNIAGFQVCRVSVNASNAPCSKYVWIWLNDALCMAGFWIWLVNVSQGFK